MLEKWSFIAFLLRCHIMRCTAGHRGCRPGELSNWSSNVSLTFSCSRLCFLCSLPLLFSLFSLFPSPSLFSQSFFFIQLPLFLCLRFLPLTLFSLFLILALTSIPPFFRSLFQQEKGNVGGPFPTGNTLIIAFWSLWHDKVCQGKAAQLHAQKDTRVHTHSKGKKYVREKQQTHRNTSPDKRLAQKDSQINTAAAVVSKQQ